MPQTKIIEAYEFYEKHAKPAVSSLQAAQDRLPMEFLLEIYAAFDHIKRFYVDQLAETEATLAAIAHLKRATLDCFKIHLKLYHDEISVFEENYDLTFLDNGSYFPLFTARKHEIHAAASRARSEYFGDTEKEFGAWEEVYLLISKFRSDLIDKYQDSVHWVKKATAQHEKQRSKKNFIQGVIAGILSSALVSFVVWLLS